MSHRRQLAIRLALGTSVRVRKRSSVAIGVLRSCRVLLLHPRDRDSGRQRSSASTGGSAVRTSLAHHACSRSHSFSNSATSQRWAASRGIRIEGGTSPEYGPRRRDGLSSSRYDGTGWRHPPKSWSGPREPEGGWAPIADHGGPQK